MLVTLAGMRIYVRFLQFKKTLALMRLQPSGISTTVMGRPSKALSPMILIAVGNLKIGVPKAGVALKVALYVASSVTAITSGVQPAKVYVYSEVAALVGVSPSYFGIRP